MKGSPVRGLSSPRFRIALALPLVAALVASAPASAATDGVRFPDLGLTVQRQAGRVIATGADGIIRWTRALATERVQSPAPGLLLATGRLANLPDDELPAEMKPHEGIDAFHESSGFVARLDPATGATLWAVPVWSRDTRTLGSSPLHVHHDRVVFTQFGRVHELDLATGRGTDRHGPFDTVVGLASEGEALVVSTRSADGIDGTYRIRDGVVSPRAAYGWSFRSLAQVIQEARAVHPGFANSALQGAVPSSTLDLHRIGSPRLPGSMDRTEATLRSRAQAVDLTRVAARYARAMELDPASPVLPLYRGLALHFDGKEAEGRAFVESTLRAGAAGRMPAAAIASVAAELERLSLSDLATKALDLHRRRFLEEDGLTFCHRFLISVLVSLPHARVAGERFRSGDVNRALVLWERVDELVPALCEGSREHAELLARWYARGRLEGRVFTNELHSLWTQRGRLAKAMAGTDARVESLRSDPLVVENGVDGIGLGLLFVLTALLASALAGPIVWTGDPEGPLADRRGALLAATLLGCGAVTAGLDEPWLVRAAAAVVLLLVVRFVAQPLLTAAAFVRAASAASSGGWPSRLTTLLRTAGPEIAVLAFLCGAWAFDRSLSLTMTVYWTLLVLPLIAWLRSGGRIGRTWALLATIGVPFALFGVLKAGWLGFSGADTDLLVVLRYGVVAALAQAAFLSAVCAFVLPGALRAQRRRSPEAAEAVRRFRPAVAVAAGTWGLVLVVAACAVWSVTWSPALFCIRMPFGIFGSPGTPGWLHTVRAARAQASDGALRLALPGRGAAARKTLALAVGLSHQVRLEKEEARRAYQECLDLAPCATNLALLECADGDRVCLTGRLREAAKQGGDRSVALYDLAVVEEDSKRVEEAVALAEWRLGPLSRHLGWRTVLAAPTSLELVRALQYAEATPGQLIGVGLDLVLGFSLWRMGWG